MDRREFLKKLGLGGAAVAGAVALGMPETTAEPEVQTLDGIAVGDKVMVFNLFHPHDLVISGVRPTSIVMSPNNRSVLHWVQTIDEGRVWASEDHAARVGIVTAILAESSGKGYLMVEVDGQARKYYTHEVKKLTNA